MIVVKGTTRVRPGDMARVREIAAWLVPAARVQEGCLAYVICEDLNDPDVVHSYELWRSEDDLAAHARSAHVVRLSELMSMVHPLELRLVSYEATAENVMIDRTDQQREATSARLRLVSE